MMESGTYSGRTLYLFRIRHLDAEMGKPTGFDEQARQQWEWIFEQVRKLPTPHRAYFDSLHEGIYEQTMHRVTEWLRELHSVRLLTHTQRMMIHLRRAGTTIEITENRTLYEAALDFINEKEQLPDYGKGDHDEFVGYLARRDCFIADRIDKTLRQGELGFLFQGVHHVIQGFLKPDIGFVEYWGHVRPAPRED